jgi:hypothetical protein
MGRGRQRCQREDKLRRLPHRHCARGAQGVSRAHRLVSGGQRRAPPNIPRMQHFARRAHARALFTADRAGKIAFNAVAAVAPTARDLMVATSAQSSSYAVGCPAPTRCRSPDSAETYFRPDAVVCGEALGSCALGGQSSPCLRRAWDSASSENVFLLRSRSLRSRAPSNQLPLRESLRRCLGGPGALLRARMLTHPRNSTHSADARRRPLR